MNSGKLSIMHTVSHASRRWRYSSSGHRERRPTDHEIHAVFLPKGRAWKNNSGGGKLTLQSFKAQTVKVTFLSPGFRSQTLWLRDTGRLPFTVFSYSPVSFSRGVNWRPLLDRPAFPQQPRRYIVTFSLCSVSARLVAAATFATLAVPANLAAQEFVGQPQFFPGNLVVSRSVYDNLAGNVTVGETLPPNCIANGCAQATNNGTYPFVFNNVIPDASFGITSRIFLDQLTTFGFLINSIEVPNSLERGVGSESNQLVTSFSSKSELGLHRSTDNRYLTFMGYVAPVNAVDVSNSNTPAAFDSTNPVPSSFLRAVARIDAFGNLSFTETNAYSGNNGRSAILNDTFGNDVYYTAGNAGNGSNPQPAGIVLGAGAQFISPANQPEVEQTPGAPTPLASFSVTEPARQIPHSPRPLISSYCASRYPRLAS